MSDFWLKCDNCNRENVGVTFVNGMRFCAKCYQETFGNTNPFYENDLRNKIAELETKLAESEKAYTDLKELEQATKESLYASREYLDKLKSEKWALEQQLAEKNKQLRTKIGNMKSTDFIKMCISCGFLVDAKVVDNQDKISFCIEQLEKVKELCKKKFAWWENTEWEGNIYDKSDVSNAYFDIEANIDNQIEELKKEMK